MSSYLEISLGPVQGFVAQARRTRDLWGGSWLLSYLSGIAIKKAIDEGAPVVHPHVTGDPILDWLQGGRSGPAPSIGSLPNHFAVQAPNPTDLANRICDAVRDEWKRIADVVWQQFFNSAVGAGSRTQDIWTRQIADTWHIRWAASDSPDGTALARRKLWNTRLPAEEPGDKCSVIHDRQELSGWIRAAGKATQQDQFWERVRQSVGPYDLREGERLSAPAAVKRLFVKVDPKTLGWQPADVQRWPSTHHLAARTWLRNLAAGQPDGRRTTAIDAAEKLMRDDPNARGVAAVVPGVQGIEGVRKLDPGRYGDLHSALPDELKPDDPPSRFYAVLLADGDRLGSLVRDHMQTVSPALASFTRKVPDVVEQHGGVTVYAGGDDLLALLPFDGALDCAKAIRDLYEAEVDVRITGGVATLSAAVTFAHAKVPLTDVLSETRKLLATVAKEENGRNSLAVGLLRPGGLQARWAASWSSDPLDRIGAVVDALSTSQELSTSGLHRVREVLALSCGWPRWAPGRWATEQLDPAPLIVGELTSASTPPTVHLDALAANIVSLARRHRNGRSSEDMLGIDGLEVARFLAGGWKEEE